MNKAIIFDMDGVVADTETAYLESCNKLLKKFNIKTAKEDWFRRFPGTGTTYIMSTIFNENEFKPQEGLQYWLEKWKEEYRKIIIKREINPIKGFLKFNKKINELKIKKIIATGSHKKNAFLVLKSFGIENEFEIIGIEDVKERKPDPKLFIVAAERLNSKPEDCIVFEDSVVGVTAAKRANMKCVAITSSNPREILEKENPDLIIDDYTEIDIEDLLKNSI